VHYSVSQAKSEQISSNGYMFSVNPAMVESKTGREVIKAIPVSNLHTESDGSFVTVGDRPASPEEMPN
jgi:TatD DNase family protein